VQEDWHNITGSGYREDEMHIQQKIMFNAGQWGVWESYNECINHDSQIPNIGRSMLTNGKRTLI